MNHPSEKKRFDSIRGGCVLILLAVYGVAGADVYRVNPYLQNPAPDAMTLVWFSNPESSGTLTYQTAGEDERTTISVPVLVPELSYQPSEIPLLPGRIDPGPPYKHQVRLKNLRPDTLYSYRVNQDGSEVGGSFGTAPLDFVPIRFVVYADSETEPESTGAHVLWPDPTGGSSNRVYYVDQTTGYRENLNIMESRSPDFIVICGDLVETGGRQLDWDEFWFHNRRDRGLAGHVPILPVLGNHEYYGGGGTSVGYSQPRSEAAVAKYRTYFDMPPNHAPNPLQEKRYYRIDYGPVSLIVLDAVNGLPNESSTDSNWFLLGETEGGQAPDYNPGSRQHQWLEEQLADAREKSLFTFVCFHHIPYSSGPHGWPPSSTRKQSGVPVRVLTPLFLHYGVDAVFSGHSEMYERSVVHGTEILPDDTTREHSIHFCDIGIGGDGLRGPQPGLENPFQAFLAHTHAPEIYNDEGLLIEGGKHYGHLEVNVFQTTDTLTWKAVIAPVHSFPLTQWNDGHIEVLGFERRVYQDEVELIHRPSSTPTPTPTPVVTPTDVPATPTPAPVSTAVRTIGPNATLHPVVSIDVTPLSGVVTYAVEETLPVGLDLVAGSISHGGAWDPVARQLRWGLFFDNTPRTLTYTVTGPDATYPVSGLANFDGVDAVITGDHQIVVSSWTPTPSPTPVAPTPTATPVPQPGDSDGNGISDEFEIAHGSDPNSTVSFPAILDFNNDGVLDEHDALLFFKHLAGLAPRDPDRDYEALDFDGDGRTTLLDALLFYRNRTGQVPVIPLPR